MSDHSILMSAPVLPFDYPAEGEEIRGCHDCLPWYAEVYTDPEDGKPWIREWHAVGCQLWDVLADDEAG